MPCPKSVFISGASRGVGLGLVRQILSLPSTPDHVIASCRDPSKAEDLQTLARKHANLKIVPLDVTRDFDILAAYDQTAAIVGEEGLTLLINNAAVHDRSDRGSLELQTREKMQHHFNTNTIAPVLITQKFLPLLKKAADRNGALPVGCQRAAVVNASASMSSIQTTLTEGRAKVYHYRASKTALNMVTALMALELKESGIVVAAVSPGWVKTDMGGSSAPLEVETSAKHIWSFVTTMTSGSSGLLHNYDGSVLPW
ncbi:C-signal-like [Babylonia areolata]|uniref:C-signal-like n=1 Tax=Babylonia areolata TaxID=304850 RepID=UPI003FD2C687